MKFLLDTNCCVVILRQGETSLLSAKLAETQHGEAVLCSVVVAELLYGAHRALRVDETLKQVQAFCAQFSSLPFDDAAAEQYGRIRADLAARGAQIGPNDLMIAAIALSNDLALVTHNTREFSRISGVRIEDWQSSA